MNSFLWGFERLQVEGLIMDGIRKAFISIRLCSIVPVASVLFVALFALPGIAYADNSPVSLTEAEHVANAGRLDGERAGLISEEAILPEGLIRSVSSFSLDRQ